MEALGAGIAIPEATRSATAITTAVTAVLSTPAYQLAAARIAASISTLPSTGYAVDLLERLARDRQPMIRPPP